MSTLKLTLEQQCELNHIRNEILTMPHLSVTEKLDSVNLIFRSVLELHTGESALGEARYELELCRRRNSEKAL